MKRCLSVAVALVAACFATAAAETYPSRPITIIVPYPAGGPSDTLARILMDSMSASLGQPFIIENVAGAGGKHRCRPSRACSSRRLHRQHRSLEHSRRFGRDNGPRLRCFERL
jgi:Tripartite tricarboxylate transporter family receptor